MSRIVREVTMDEVRQRVHGWIYYGVITPWWSDRLPYRVPCGQPGAGLPCDPRGGVLMQTDNPERFLRTAEEKSGFYGKHGLRAFLAAFHGVVVADNGRSTCLSNWDEYNALLDAHDATKKEE